MTTAVPMSVGVQTKRGSRPPLATVMWAAVAVLHTYGNVNMPMSCTGR